MKEEACLPLCQTVLHVQDLEKRLERLKPSKPIAAPLSARRFMNESDSDED